MFGTDKPLASRVRVVLVTNDVSALILLPNVSIDAMLSSVSSEGTSISID